MDNYEKLVKLGKDYKGRLWSEIPKERIEDIDWFGYGWPTIDADGEYIGVYQGEGDLNDGAARMTIVTDPHGTDWLLLDYPSDENEQPPLPAGFTVSRDNY